MIVTGLNQGWGEKVNFTDSNDVFVGFDMFYQCCEDFGWYVAKEITTNDEREEIDDFDGYVFDVNFFKELESNVDEGGYAVFKLIKYNCDDLYLHLYNHHNGYYSHGFEATVGGEPWQEGDL